MKKNRMVCLMIALVMLLCACGNSEGTEVTQPTQGKYQPLIDRLEAGDYDAARAMIDAMDGKKEELLPTETEGAEALPAETVRQTEAAVISVPDGNRVELTKENVKEYFEVTENFFRGPKPGFEVGLALKEEYAGKLAAVEDAAVKVSFLTAEAHGTVDASGEFQGAGYVITGEGNPTWVEISDGGLGSLANGSYAEKKGYFPEYPVDVVLTDGRGVLIFTE